MYQIKWFFTNWTQTFETKEEVQAGADEKIRGNANVIWFDNGDGQIRHGSGKVADIFKFEPKEEK